MTASFRVLTSFPRNRLIEDELLRCRAPELDLLSTFGPPQTRPVASKSSSAVYWDLEWSCELVMGLEFDQLTEVLTMRLDRPETAHGLRHLGFPVTDLWTMEKDAPGRFADLPDADDRRWQLWHQDADGHAELVLTNLARRDALCREAELAAGGEDYWVTSDD